jgi:hypothetical protein
MPVIIEPLIAESSIPVTTPIKMATRMNDRKASSFTMVVRRTRRRIPVMSMTMGIGVLFMVYDHGVAQTYVFYH